MMTVMLQTQATFRADMNAVNEDGTIVARLVLYVGAEPLAIGQTVTLRDMAYESDGGPYGLAEYLGRLTPGLHLLRPIGEWGYDSVAHFSGVPG